MTKQELQEILGKHKKWLNKEPGGERAYLNNADLSNADLRMADLRGADLRNANLFYADLFYADLRGANLFHANLFHANLYTADLRGANLICTILCYAFLHNANLSHADLRNANLSVADLSNADLSETNLHDTYFYQSNLFHANLYTADLSNADLSEANLVDTMLPPKEMIRKGIVVKRKMIGWKKCRNDVLVKLEIPKGAIVFSINNDACRTNIAKVVEIEGGNGRTAISHYDDSFVYKLGKTIIIKDFDCQYNLKCGKGIHFFRTRKKAKEYNG